MLYIISGIAKAGKSFLSKQIVEKYPLGYFSTDYLMMSLVRGNKSLNIDSNASDITVSNQLKPYLEGMFRTMIENQIDYVVEGVHIQPDFADALLKQYPNKVKIIYLGYRLADASNKTVELKQFGHQTENHWFSSMNDAELHNLVLYLIRESGKLYDNCLKYHLPYYEITNISEQANGIIKDLIEH